jgi:hypothetical protein
LSFINVLFSFIPSLHPAGKDCQPGRLQGEVASGKKNLPGLFEDKPPDGG